MKPQTLNPKIETLNPKFDLRGVGRQCALLYTTVNGERRIRVHTLALPCTNVLGNLFRSADLDVQLYAHVSAVCSALTIYEKHR